MINTSQPLSYYDVPDPQRVQEAYTGAMQIVHQRVEAGKDREQKAELQKAQKKLSYKVDPKTVKYESDAPAMHDSIQNQIAAVQNGEDPAKYAEESRQIQQANEIHSQSQVKQNTDKNELGKTYAIKEDQFNNDQQEAVNTTYDKRGGVLDRNQSKLANAEYIDPTKSTMNVYNKDWKDVTPSASSDIENGADTLNSKQTWTTKMPINTKEAEQTWDGKKMVSLKDDNGNIIYKQRAPLNKEEVYNSKYPDAILQDPNLKKAWTNEFVHNDSEMQKVKKDVEKYKEDMILAGTPVDDVSLKSYTENKINQGVKEQVANTLWSQHKGALDATLSRKQDEPRESDIKASKRKLGKVGSGNDQEVEVTTGQPNNERRDFVSTRDANGRVTGQQEAYSKSPVQFQLYDTHGDKKKLAGESVIIPSSTEMFSSTRGKINSDVSQVGKYMNTSFEITKKKDGVKTIERTNSNDYAKKVYELKADGYEVGYEPFNNFIVLSNKNPYTNKASVEYKEYEELKTLKSLKSTDEISANSTRVGELEAKFANKMDNVSTPAKATIGQISRFNSNPDEIVNSHADDNTKQIHQSIKNAINSPVPEGIKREISAKKKDTENRRSYNEAVKGGKGENWLKTNNMKISDGNFVHKDAVKTNTKLTGSNNVLGF